MSDGTFSVIAGHKNKTPENNYYRFMHTEGIEMRKGIEMRRFRSSCACAQSRHDLYLPLIHSTISDNFYTDSDDPNQSGCAVWSGHSLYAYV